MKRYIVRHVIIAQIVALHPHINGLNVITNVYDILVYGNGKTTNQSMIKSECINLKNACEKV